MALLRATIVAAITGQEVTVRDYMPKWSEAYDLEDADTAFEKYEREFHE